MEARATLRGPKVSRTLVAGVLVVVALGVGAMGGYVAANLGGGKAASPSHTAAKAIADQSKAVLPDWVVQEITPKTAPAARILQDDIIRSAKPTGVPDWIAKEFPAEMATATNAEVVAACPAGTHIVSGYSIKAWVCLSDTPSHSAKVDE